MICILLPVWCCKVHESCFTVQSPLGAVHYSAQSCFQLLFLPFWLNFCCQLGADPIGLQICMRPFHIFIGTVALRVSRPGMLASVWASVCCTPAHAMFIEGSIFWLPTSALFTESLSSLHTCSADSTPFWSRSCWLLYCFATCVTMTCTPCSHCHALLLCTLSCNQFCSSRHFWVRLVIHSLVWLSGHVCMHAIRWGTYSPQKISHTDAMHLRAI